MQVVVPDALRSTDESSPVTIAAGPFVVEHGGNSIGGFLEDFGDEITLWDGSRVYVIDDSYTTQTENDEITFHSEIYSSTFVIRPIEDADMEWIPGSDQYNSLESLVTGLAQIMKLDVYNA